MGWHEMAYTALGAVIDPELDEPITSLGFVRSLSVSPGGNVKVHLRLPTSFCSPNFAYLMASDAKDVLRQLDWTRQVTVELDDHHDSPIINAGLAADAGYRGTFGHEADESLDELRETFRRKAHTAAMERCLTALLRVGPGSSGVVVGGGRRSATCPTTPPRPRWSGAARHSDCPRRQTRSSWSTTSATATHPTRCRWRCAARVRRGSPSTATPTSAEGCCAPATATSRQPSSDVHTRHRSPTSRKKEHHMSTMRAVQVVGYHQNLEMKEVPAPTPTGPFDVVVKIGGAGVCRTDLHILEGQWAEKNPDLQLPYTIGHENAGWVHAIGSAVTNVAEGDKVILHPLITCGLCRACRSGNDVHCEASAFPGIDTNGGYAEYLKTSARSVVKIDDALEPSDVAALADAGLTAHHAAAKAARRLTPRDRCVIIGAGGLGHIGIQVLKALSPAELIVVDRNAEALKLAEAIGADHGVLADGTQVEQVLEMTGGHGAEAVVDFVGEGGATSEGVAMLRRAGDYHVVGYGENIDVPTIDIVSTEINFIGNLVGSYNDLCDLMALAARGRGEPAHPEVSHSTTSSPP